jgi:sporulation protein YlmC with PRC-barrel domain
MALKTLSRRSRVDLPGGAYDVRGWQVRTQLDGEKVGTVEEMLVDEHDHPHLLDVDVGALRKHVLLPLSEAHADPVEHVVWIDRLDKDRLKELPEYDRSPERLSSAFEERLLEEYRVLASGNGHSHARGSTLARLGDLQEHRVAKGVSDPRGWKVLGGDGQTIGEVEELIVDKTEMTTRYLDCKVEEKHFGLEPLNRHVLIPVEHVRLHRDEKRVLVDGLFGRDLKQYPIYPGLPLASVDESRVHAMFGHRRSAASGDGANHFFAGDRAVANDADVAGPIDTLGTRVERVHHVRAGDQDVRIRISGSDIIIEKQGRGGENDG